MRAVRISISRKLGQLVRLVTITCLVATAGLSGTAASDENFNLGAVSVPGTLNIGNSYTSGSFTDTYSFSVLSDASISGALASLNILNIVGISDFTSSLWLGGGLLAMGVTETVNYFGGAVEKTISTIDYSPLLAGPPAPIYEIRATGTVIGYGGWYGGSLALNPVVAAVPEPEIYAMMAVGMGVLGWAARRKKRMQHTVA